ncbi:hypothetical protein VitviT2T_017694 [Vitis vinifera]|nr:hypothetical protein VitviT2T_017694 [Vitis vinifera]
MFSQFLSLFLSSFFFLNSPSVSVSATEFIFNSFNSTSLLLYGNATIQNSLLFLTNETTFSIGRALYPSKVPTRSPNSTHLLPFSSSFIFSIPPYKNRLPGHGFAFLFAPTAGMDGVSSSQHLGLFNFTNDGKSTNHVFAVEFDVFENQEFNDIDDNHVGVDVNSLTSLTSHEAGYWSGEDDDDENFEELELNNGENYQVWIEYMDSRINVTMERAGRKRPDQPLISAVVNLSDVLLDEMYVGFCGATGQLVEGHIILSWSFSQSNFSIGDALETMNLASFVLPRGSVFRSKGFALGVSLGSAVLLVGLGVMLYVALVRRRKKRAIGEEIQEWELEYWPHRIGYSEIYTATDGFSEKNVIGFSSNGKVYKGVLVGGPEVAVKSIPHENEHGMKAFLAEVSSLGRLKHRNLVGLRGWCKKEKGDLILVYDYMENGSLEKRIFHQYPESMMLSWEERARVLKDVGHGILYLHEGWEATVLHRDIKASNVLLDKDMNARLGDFGLARMHHHGDLANTTRVVGTLGYMAPEVIRTGRATVQTDVFGFGVLVLEVVCGREPIQHNKPGLVDWVWRLMERGELVLALDERLKARGEYREEEVERVLQIGLLCAHPDPRRRLMMRQVVKALEGRSEGSEPEEGMDVSLLHSAEWSKRNSYSDGGGHPTFDEIQKSLLCSTSLSVSDIILEGR